MEEYYFLFALGALWMLFASVQDFRTREISNWLNFSLIAFALSYRAFYSNSTGNWNFLWFGIGGVLLFVSLGYLFYYGKVFAGGDAKLLFGVGGLLPFESLFDYLILGGGFVLILFLTGAVYTLWYSLFLVLGDFGKFKKNFFRKVKGNGKYFFILLILLLLSVFFDIIVLLFFAIIIGMFFLYVYMKIIEECFMIKKVDASKLTEGDWLERDVRVGEKWIRKKVHGLSLEEIRLLKNAKKKVWVKEGVPFGIVFLISFVLFFVLWNWFRGFFFLI